MLRRSHRKSRGGCLQCKRRHVKCDEGRPTCLLCTMSGRECSFAAHVYVKASSSSRNSSHERARSPGDVHGQGSTMLPERTLTPSTIMCSPDFESQAPLCTRKPVEFPMDEPINVTHMELVIHLISDPEVFSLSYDNGDYRKSVSLGLNRALESPYLLHQMLAFSARHLAHQHPERSTFFLQQAIALQTRALSLFNAALTKVDQSNCVPILLFSTTLGHHLLADSLAHRDHGGIGAFLGNYVQCIEVHRGIYTIARSAWPMLMETELEPFLAWSASFTSREPHGDHCNSIVEMVNNSLSLSAQEKEACQLAIEYLQVGFDVDPAKEEEGNPHQMLFSWTMLASTELTNLLASKQPEALILLAYYAVLLHGGKHLWQVGDAGVHIMSLIEEELGPEWVPWLEYPRKMMLGRDSAEIRASS